MTANYRVGRITRTTLILLLLMVNFITHFFIVLLFSVHCTATHTYKSNFEQLMTMNGPWWGLCSWLRTYTDILNSTGLLFAQYEGSYWRNKHISCSVLEPKIAQWKKVKKNFYLCSTCTCKVKQCYMCESPRGQDPPFKPGLFLCIQTKLHRPAVCSIC